jgi:DNA-binding winged helix-turn-helix (wHTH) protein/TolB-like protein/Tfp pilus assembly protein PilF
MSENPKHFYEFGEYRLDPFERRLLRGEKVIALTPKAFETLCILVENNGRLVEKNRLLETLWADSFVEEGNIADNVSKIRQALGDSPKNPKFIETVSGRGYRFLAQVRRIEEEEIRNETPVSEPSASASVLNLSEPAASSDDLAAPESNISDDKLQNDDKIKTLTAKTFFFGDFELDVEKRFLLKKGQAVALNPKAFDLLLTLIENRGAVLSKDELLEKIWENQFVEENNLTVHISALRKIFGEKKNEHRFIVTVPGKGYKFVADIHNENQEKELVIEKHSFSRIIVEEEKDFFNDRDAESGINKIQKLTEKTNRRWFVALSILGIFALGAAGLFLWRGNGKSADASVKTIAVLPFKPLVVNDRDESLELGMSDSLITRLGSIRQITVRPISAVRRYTDLEQDAAEAGRELQVESVLEGNIQRAGERIRITARLVRVEDGVTLWTETFDEKFTDIFAVQDSISQKIVGALALQLSGEERNQLTKKYTANTEAYQLYLKGRYFWNKVTPEGFEKSLEFYRQAIDIDPNYALAYAGVADSYNLLGSYGVLPMKESHPKARGAAEKALEIDAELAEAHTSLAAVIADYYWDWAAAETHFKQAIRLNPNYPIARYWYSQQLARMGRLDESIEEAKRAQTLDPISPSANAHVGLALYRARRYDEAIAQLKKALEIDAGAFDAHIFLGFVYIQQGRSEEAIAEFQTVVKLSQRNPNWLALLGYAYATAGKRDEANAILKELNDQKQLVSPFETALIYIGLGEHEQAFTLLEKAYNERAWQMGLLKVEPIFDPLRSDSRFTDLMRRVNLTSR